MSSTLAQVKLERLKTLRGLRLRAEAHAAEAVRRRWPTPGAMAVDLDPATVQTDALRRVDAELVAVTTMVRNRNVDYDLHIYLPPQEGKSERVSRRWPLWLLAQDPTLRIVVLSYGDELATSWGRKIRRDILAHPDAGVALAEDSRAAGRWNTPQGGGLYCAGIRGSVAGFSADILVIDDPVKNREQAESAQVAERNWEVYENVAVPRLSDRGVIVIMTTRWNKRDLAGRALEARIRPQKVLSIPAVAEQADPLGRAPGTELVSSRRRKPGYFLNLQERMSAYAFRSIYQQQPTDPKGSLFPRGGWRFWNWRSWPNLLSLDGRTVDLRDCWRFLTVDLAASKKTSADWTVGAAWALTMDRQLVCLGRVRDRTDEGGHWALIAPLAQEWRAPDVGVESTMMGTTLVRQAVRAGLAPFDLRADTDKVTRAIPAGHMVTQGQVWLPADADWLDEFISEAADFPAGAHDDQVDVLAYAAKLAHGWQPTQSPGMPQQRRPDEFETAMGEALGRQNGHDPLNNI